MIPFYRKRDSFEIFEEKTVGYSVQQIHNQMEIVLCTRGTLTVAVEKELCEVKKGGILFIFPNQIHTYQKLVKETTSSICLIASSTLSENYSELLLSKKPVSAVIPSSKVHPEVVHALHELLNQSETKWMKSVERNQRKDNRKENSEITEKAMKTLQAAYLQIILTYLLPELELEERSPIDEASLVDRIMVYIGKNYREDISLDRMAHDLGVNPYTLSRQFASVFRMNFNQYVNDQRLEHAVTLLRYTTNPITDICLEAGFQSQRTFNRVFLERHHMSPQEYRRLEKHNELSREDI